MPFRPNRRTLILGTLAAAASHAGPARAGGTILTVGGRIAGGRPKTFSLADLDAMPKSGFTTTTPWDPAAVGFEGVDLDAFLKAVGAEGTRLRLIALNDYVVMVDVAEIEGRGALLATRKDGAAMPVSDKGPVFLIFPFDGHPELQHQSFYSRAVWQLATIDVL